MFLAAFIAVALAACIANGQSPSEGTVFALTLPPASVNVPGELIINSRYPNSIIVEFPYQITDLLHIVPNETIRYELDSLMRASDGIENVGVKLTASFPMSVQLASGAIPNGQRTPETTIVRPVTDEDTDYYVVSYAPASASNAGPKSFYCIVSTEGDTEVYVYETVQGSEVLVEEVTIGANQVFTYDPYHHEQDDHLTDVTGFRVRASKPVAVYAGNGYALVPSNDGNQEARYVYDSVPSVHQLGTNYLTFAQHFGERLRGYHVRIVGVENDTVVNVPALEYTGTLTAGQFHSFDWVSSRQGTPLSCSKPCLVAQYANRAGPGESPGQRFMRPFMAVLTPMDQLANDVIFSTPSLAEAGGGNVAMALALVSDYYPTDTEGLYMDGVNLNYLDWTAAGVPIEGFFATMDLEPGTHQLTSFDSGTNGTTIEHGRFTAYLHGSGSREGIDYSFGNVVGYGVVEPDDVTTADLTIWQRIKQFLFGVTF